MGDSILYVVTKAPRPGEAKTRLSPTLTPDQGAAVARAFLLDVVDLARRARGIVVRAICRGEADTTDVRQLCGRDIDVLCQPRPGLGAALEMCFRHGLADGFTKVAVLGSDTPTLPVRVVEDAFAALDLYDLAVGPSEDGGYYLLGARDVHRSLFVDMTWSTDHVFKDTMGRAERIGLRTAILPRWYDVDTPTDLARLAREIARGAPGCAPHSRRALDAIWPLPVQAEPTARPSGVRPGAIPAARAPRPPIHDPVDPCVVEG